MPDGTVRKIEEKIIYPDGTEQTTAPGHGDIDFLGTVSADGQLGLTGERIVGGYVWTFTKGILTGFEPE